MNQNEMRTVGSLPYYFFGTTAEYNDVMLSCCYQEKKVAIINDIIQKYETALKNDIIESNISVMTSNNSDIPENIKNIFIINKGKLGDIDDDASSIDE